MYTKPVLGFHFHGFNFCIFELVPPSKAFTILSLLLSRVDRVQGETSICGYVFVCTSTFELLYRFILLFQRFQRNLSFFRGQHHDKARDKVDSKTGNGHSPDKNRADLSISKIFSASSFNAAAL